jgi:hypothetical protein
LVKGRNDEGGRGEGGARRRGRRRISEDQRRGRGHEFKVN